MVLHAIYRLVIYQTIVAACPYHVRAWPVERHLWA
jgi:hypothetical protein